MRLCSVDLTNFRNYDRLKLSFGEGTHILYGDNAQGKTNLLEAIYLCTCARSHRTGRDEELIKHNEDFYRTTVDFMTDQGIQETVSVEYRQASGRSGTSSRIIRYNGLEIGRLADMMGLFHAILFAPEDLQIVKDGPSERRRFLNILIARTDRTYFRDLQDFGRVLGQRNSLLKNLKANNRLVSPDSSSEEANEFPAIDPVSQLDIWDETLAEVAASLLVKRLAHVEKLSEFACLSLQHLTSSQETLDIQYKGFSGLEPGMDVESIKMLYLRRLKRSREDDIARGSTSYGPHRDDMILTLNGTDARVYASQGQQRSVVLALKIAELMILTAISGEKPILLLDDVMSELDVSRRSQLMEVIRGHQVFITCTDPDQIFLPKIPGEASSFVPEWNSPVRLYSVKAGTVKPTGAIET
ncbi:MAG: DNA replication/repair protein RecF [Clostridiaceae bacterium]|nr:DNA replication/repair protein RecF [Clostridiaceae bacterium]